MNKVIKYCLRVTVESSNKGESVRDGFEEVGGVAAQRLCLGAPPDKPVLRPQVAASTHTAAVSNCTPTGPGNLQPNRLEIR